MNTYLDNVLRDGVLLRREAVEIGIEDQMLTASVRNHVLARIRQGAYAEWHEWQNADRRRRHELLTNAVVRLYGDRSLLSFHSAVVAHGCPTWGLDLTNVHLSYPGANGRIAAGVVHHIGERRPDDIVRPAGGWMRSPTRAVIESTMRSQSVEVGVCLMSDLLHRGLSSPQLLTAAREEIGDQRGALKLRTAVALADSRLSNVAESRCWYWLRRADLPEVVPQYAIFDRSGRPIAYVDFAIPELRVFVEFDGREKYERYRRPGETVADVIIRERRRENWIRELTGWEVVRISWSDLSRPDLIAERILAVAARRAS